MPPRVVALQPWAAARRRAARPRRTCRSASTAAAPGMTASRRPTPVAIRGQPKVAVWPDGRRIRGACCQRAARRPRVHRPRGEQARPPAPVETAGRATGRRTPRRQAPPGGRPRRPDGGSECAPAAPRDRGRGAAPEPTPESGSHTACRRRQAASTGGRSGIESVRGAGSTYRRRVQEGGKGSPPAAPAAL
jgi:hypothetical protein